MGGDSVITIEDLVNETGINESTNTSSTSSTSTTTSSSDTSSTSSSTSTSSSPLNNDPFYATSENVAVGTSITLSWNSSAQSCSAGGTWSGNKNSSGSESVTISTPGWNLFTLSCGSSYAVARPQHDVTIIPISCGSIFVVRVSPPYNPCLHNSASSKVSRANMWIFASTFTNS